jgi:type IV pilus assembly protein PilY1
LWQLTEDASGNPIFGKSGSTPLITTLFVDSGGSKTEVAVAVLPGGEDPDPPLGTSTTRKNASPTNIDSLFPARTLVPAYATAEKNKAARSLTIVRLDTGEVIRSLRADANLPAGIKAKSRTLAADFDSPITGTPVAFPGTTGSIADRMFVGDRDGSLWRIDVASTDPSNWSAKLFFDAYSGKTFDAGQPISTPPVLSVDLKGNVTLAISTGDQETLVATAGMKNYVYALTERPTGTAFASHVNWDIELSNGERVTGPMSLFNGALYFSSYTPESPTSTNVCGEGASRVWGMDYLLPKVTGATALTDLDDGGKERLPDGSGGFVQYLDQTASMLTNAGIIFGVGVAAVPSCIDETSITDPYFGVGNHARIDNISPGSYQLVMQVSGTGNVSDNSRTQRVEINLPTPPSSTRIDSWAAIVE